MPGGGEKVQAPGLIHGHFPFSGPCHGSPAGDGREMSLPFIATTALFAQGFTFTGVKKSLKR